MVEPCFKVSDAAAVSGDDARVVVSVISDVRDKVMDREARMAAQKSASKLLPRPGSDTNSGAYMCDIHGIEVQHGSAAPKEFLWRADYTFLSSLV
jgi:hypothetical protein